MMDTQLNQSEDYLASLEATMLKVEACRSSINKFVRLHKKCRTQRRFAAAYYIYLKSGCKLYFEIPRLMAEYLNMQNFRKELNHEPTLMCLVSATNDSLGTIVNANVALKEFFGINQ